MFEKPHLLTVLHNKAPPNLIKAYIGNVIRGKETGQWFSVLVKLITEQFDRPNQESSTVEIYILNAERVACLPALLHETQQFFIISFRK